MMLLAEVARQEGLFDWLAAVATKRAKGSPGRLFLLIYLVGTVVTVFLSNDAAAVVLTPAVAAAVKTAKAKDPLPYLFICAFIANAASFVLPISNPANLVIYGAHMPPLLQWLPRFALPSAAVDRRDLRGAAPDAAPARWRPTRWRPRWTCPPCRAPASSPPRGSASPRWRCSPPRPSTSSSAGPPRSAGCSRPAAVLLVKRAAPWDTVKDVSWAVLPLVAGLFVMVEALDRTGLIRAVGDLLHRAAEASAAGTAWGAGALIAVLCNVVNNLPAGLIAGSAVETAHVPEAVTSAVLVGVDIGPNLSVTGSLATILWLTALKREEITVSAWQFLKLGALVMPPALVLALAGLILTPDPRAVPPSSRTLDERHAALSLHHRRGRAAVARQFHERAAARAAGEPLARRDRVVPADRLRLRDAVPGHAAAAADARTRSAACRGTRPSAASRAPWRCSAGSPSWTRSAPGPSTASSSPATS